MGLFGSDDSTEPSELQQEILETAERNLDMNHRQIADVVGCSPSHVGETLREFGDPRDGDGGRSRDGSDDKDLGDVFGN